MKRAILALLLWAATVGATWAQSRDSEALRQALAALQRGEFEAATAAVDGAGDLARDIVAWHRLRAGKGSFAEYRDFLARRPDWPGLPLLRQMGEESIPRGSPDPEATLAYFAGQLPRTGTGSLRLAEALSRIGAQPIAADEIRRAWLTLSLTPLEQKVFLESYGPALEGLHEARLDNLLWQARFAEATTLLPLVSPEARALAETRIALMRGQRGVDAMIEALPETALQNPGLAYARFLWRMRAGRTADAEELLIAQSTRPGGLGRPEFWAGRRLSLAYSAMQDGRPGRAYLIAATHGLQSGSDYAALEWLAGYVALTRLDDPAVALGHFRRFRVAVFTPISLGRAGYWEGRALEALGREDEARTAFAFGAEFQTSFYGQLAAIRAGLPMDPAMAGTESYPDLAGSALAQSSVLKAALLLHEAGDSQLFRRFLRHLAETATDAEKGALADLALSLDEPFAAVHLAKYAADGGAVVPRPYFPVPGGFDGDLPVDPALALAIARRESEFNPDAISRAGARGMMQLMPGTADLVARELGIDHSLDQLTGDPGLNVRLGTAYLARLIEEFDGYLPFVAAGYNAGPNRVTEWRTRFGDPRGDVERAIDWIESIPFRETRNYVMRVLEGYEVYRARLAGRPVEWSLHDILAGR